MKLSMLLAILVCVGLSTAVDTISVYYWKKPSWLALAGIIVLAPCVFITFGYVGEKYGLSIASCLTNAFVVIGPILVGFFVFSEYQKMTVPLWVGMALIVIGIITIAMNKQIPN